MLIVINFYHPGIGQFFIFISARGGAYQVPGSLGLSLQIPIKNLQWLMPVHVVQHF
jgi:hypothetical protein